MTFPASFYVHTVTVETSTAGGSLGPGWAAPVPVDGFLDDERKLIVSAAGEQVVSSSTFYTSLANADLFTLDSKVTVNGRTARVLGAKRRDTAGMLTLDHLEVELS